MKICTTMMAFAMLFICLIGNGQSNLQTYHLKNGAVISGEITEKNRFAHKLKTDNGINVEFDKIEETEPSKSKVQKSFHSRIEILLGNVTDNDQSYRSFGINGLIGFSVGNRFYWGVCVEYQETFIRYHYPIYFDMRLDLVLGKLSPYLFVNAGIVGNEWKNKEHYYNQTNHGFWGSETTTEEIEVTLNNDLGHIGRVGLGFETPLNAKFNLLTSIYISYQTYSSKDAQAKSQAPSLLGSSSLSKEDQHLNEVGFKLGVSFN